MDIQDILSLIEAVSMHSLTELKLEDGTVRLSLKRDDRKNGRALMLGQTPAAKEQADHMAGQALPGQNSDAAQGGRGFALEQTVVSPLVGTFYSSSSPEAEAFVKTGDSVKKGQVLGIIEAMKLMNEIESEYDGVVEAILVNNEDVVEYGQPLFRIRPT